MKTKTGKQKILIVLIVLVVLAALILGGVLAAGKFFTAQEKTVRAGWSVDAGELIGSDEENAVELAEAELTSDLKVLTIWPNEIEDEDFTYYDIDVQDRLAAALDRLKEGRSWAAETPLAVLNPYGTGSNGLYLYFETELDTSISYTIHVEDESIPDFTARAVEADGSEYTTEHEFQLIGLVPGETNEVTLTVTGSWGAVRQRIVFSIEMPGTYSEYPTRLECTIGDSTASLVEGLYTMMRVNGYLGYGFMYDNAGVLRYEMVLEGYGLDRTLFYEDEMIACVSANKLARFNTLGRVTQVYALGEYELHHDVVLDEDSGTLLALAELVDDPEQNVEDLLLEIDVETGEVSLLLDFKQAMSEYYQQDTRPVGVTDDFFWQVGERDWIHLNTLQYLPDDDSVIVSSRETSTIVKVSQVHSQPTLDWLCGDPAFWADTAYADLCLQPVGDFVYQYGQHSVEYHADGDEEGVYYLRMYNNNYWSLNTRDYEAALDGEVKTDLYGDEDDNSYVYIYKIDENARTFELTESFAVPYSSIVSNAQPVGAQGNWVVNSGMANLWGEYDSEGVLIRQFAYPCTMQNYRVFKYDYKGFWFR